MTPNVLDDHLAAFQWRVIQDALQEGTAAYWERRAETFANVGNARCDQIALACRNHAQLVRDIGLDQAVTDLIREVLTGMAPAARVEIVKAG